MNACEEMRPELVAYARGDLTGLAHTRLEAHLDHCGECRRAEALIATGLSQAQRYEPNIDQEELARLQKRIIPELEATPRSVAWARPALALAAALLLVFGGLWMRRRPVEVEPMVASAPAPTPTQAPSLGPTAPALAVVPSPTPVVSAAPTLAVADLSRISLGRAGTALATKDVVLRPSRRGAFRFDRGFAVIDVPAGAHLNLGASGLELKAENARFWIDAAPGEVASVGVVRGRVELITADRSTILGPGEARGVPRVAAEAAVLNEPAPSPTQSPASAAPIASPRRVRPVTAQLPAASPDVLSALADAETLADRGKQQEAVEIYDRLLAGGALPRNQRDLVELERARVVGLGLGRTAEARRVLVRLERQSGVTMEAAFTRCELDLEKSPCSAQRCLVALSKRPATAKEAAVLLDRWDLQKIECDDHNSEP
ncbi:MAG: zf-HC2 domain-containing protein [Myxococcota bacterium]